MFPVVISQILLLHVISLHASLRERLSFNESNLTSEITVHLVQKCFLQNDRTVAVIGSVPDIAVEMLHRSEIAATASIGNSRSRTDGMYEKIFHSMASYRQSFWIRLRRVVQVFVVAAPTQSLLHLVLETARTSVWWNSAAFFIVTSTFENNDCRNAFTYLWTLWQMGILHSIFLCEESNGSLAVYGYSPYYHGHGGSWRKVGVYDGRGGHPWTLLKLKQVHDTDICEMLVFDKVRTLDGYPIPVGILKIPPTLVINKKGEDWFDKHVGEDAMIVHTIWNALNGSIQPIYYKGENPIGFARENQTYTGFMADIATGRVDHGVNGLWANFHFKIGSAYPHARSGVHLLTPSRGDVPSWWKFATIYDIPVTLGIQATLLIAMIFLRYVDHRSWPGAILEVIRAVLSVTMLHLPRSLSTRLFWSMVFVMILVITSVFQGLLISILTKPTAYRNIDTIDDMLDSGYNIYGYTAFKTIFDESKLSKQFHVGDRSGTYLTDIARGRPIAYASDYMHQRAITMSTKGSHMSRQAVESYYTAYLTKLDWPLFKRFDTLVQRLFNAGITKYWREYYLNQIARENWAEMRKTSPLDLKVLSVADLTFVFNILIVGLICSFVAFVIELILGCFRY